MPEESVQHGDTLLVELFQETPAAITGTRSVHAMAELIWEITDGSMSPA